MATSHLEWSFDPLDLLMPVLFIENQRSSRMKSLEFQSGANCSMDQMISKGRLGGDMSEMPAEKRGSKSHVSDRKQKHSFWSQKMEERKKAEEKRSDSMLWYPLKELFVSK